MQLYTIISKTEKKHFIFILITLKIPKFFISIIFLKMDDFLWVFRRILMFSWVFWMFYYFFWRIFVIFWWYSNYKQIIIITIVLVLVMIIMMFVFRMIDVLFTDLLSNIFMILTIFIFFSLFFLVIEHWISFFYKINKRIFLWVFVSCFVYSIWNAYQIRFVDLNIESPKVTNDLNIAFISDIHASDFKTDKHIQKLLEKIMSKNPDMILIAWDLVDDVKQRYINHLSPFKDISIPVYAVLWNHDNWNFGDYSFHNILQIAMWDEDWDATNEWNYITLLENQSVQSWELGIIWVEDKSSWWSKNIDQLLSGINMDPSKFNILITHQPIALEKIEKYPIDLEIAWHTHNGQFIPFTRIVWFFNDYKYWLYTHNDQKAFVSQWVWFWWFPIRFGTNNEIIMINLSSTK